MYGMTFVSVCWPIFPDTIERKNTTFGTYKYNIKLYRVRFGGLFWRRIIQNKTRQVHVSENAFYDVLVMRNTKFIIMEKHNLKLKSSIRPDSLSKPEKNIISGHAHS